MKNRAVLWGVINWALLAGVLVVNTLSVVLPLNGRTPGEIADSFRVLFEPAGYVFSIWSLIYIGLVAFAVFQLLPSQRDNPRVRATDGWFALSCLANIGWIFSWHYGLYPLSMAAMLVLLASLIAIYLSQRSPRSAAASLTLGTRILACAPFSLYLGWISVATIANAAAVLSWAGFSGFGVSPVAWTVIVSCLAAVLSAAMSIRNREIIFPAVVVWALIGEIVRQAAVPAIVWGCIAAISVAAVAAVDGILVRPAPKTAR
jgi:hypothetical protein